MKRSVRIFLTIALAAVFAGSVGMMVYQKIQYQQGEETYLEAEELVELPDFSQVETPPAESGEPETGETASVYVDPYAEALRNMDFAALRKVNSEVLGWILIPGTPISYPFLQGADNQYYLKRTWKKQSSAVGAIFLECGNRPDFSDFNTIVYGHRMNNGSMFAALKYYKQQSYWASHPNVYITDENGTRTYRIFAAYEVSTQGDAYRLGFSDETARQSFLDTCMSLSVISTGVTPTVNDRILTLSTCTGNGHATRWVVQAVCESDDPPAAETEGGDAAEEPAAPEEAGTAAGTAAIPEETPSAAAETGSLQTDAPQETPAALPADAAEEVPQTADTAVQTP